jgi:hypothetical protein
MSSGVPVGDLRSLAHGATWYLKRTRCGCPHPYLEPEWLYFLARREASSSCPCHGICLNIDFHEIDRGGKNHGGCDPGW